jgi:phage terminase large subunit-like protein
VLERRKSIASQLLDFARDGSLTIVDRLPDDITQVVDLVAQVDESGLLAAVGLDQIGIGGIIDALAERGIENVEGGDQRVVGISQGWKLAGAIKTAERKLADGTLTHAGQPLMAWAVSNAKVEPRGNALMITKQTAGAAKIDPLIALFNAVALMGMNPEAICPRSVYEDRGILIF